MDNTDNFKDFPIESLRKLLDYTYADEERDYEATNASVAGRKGKNQPDHIFTHIRNLSNWEYKTRKGL